MSQMTANTQALPHTQGAFGVARRDLPRELPGSDGVRDLRVDQSGSVQFLDGEVLAGIACVKQGEHHR
jgi:hypothetical protein